jgi:C4-dicarboxylate-specific signal transduction histidine kinase
VVGDDQSVTTRREPGAARRRLDPRRWRIGTKLAVALVAAAVLPLVVLGEVAADRTRDEVRNDARARLRSLAAAIATGVDAELRANLELVEATARTRTVIDFAADPTPVRTAAVQAELDTLKATHPSAGIFFVLDPAGVAIASSDRAILGGSYAFRPYFGTALAGSATVSEVYLPIGTTSGVPGTAFAAPIRAGGTNGPILGVAVIKSDALTVSPTLAGGAGRRAFVVESTGVVSAHPDADLRFSSLRRLTRAEQAEAAAARRFAGPVPTVATSGSVRALVGATRPGLVSGRVAGTDVTVAWQPLTVTDWVVAVSEPSATYDAAADRARRDTLLVTGAVAVVAALLALLAARRLGRPITVLTATADALGAGTPIDDDALDRVARRRDDLGGLAARLAAGVRDARARETRLEAQVAALRVEIDQHRRAQDVAAVVESEAFTDIAARAADLRRRARDGEDTPVDGEGTP